MDRDKRWERTQKAYDAMVFGEGLQAASAKQALLQSYERKDTDEFVIPTLITDDNGEPVAMVKQGDSIIFFNFRPDRARQLTYAFVTKTSKDLCERRGIFRLLCLFDRI